MEGTQGGCENINKSQFSSTVEKDKKLVGLWSVQESQVLFSVYLIHLLALILVKWISSWQRVTWADLFTERFETVIKSAV